VCVRVFTLSWPIFWVEYIIDVDTVHIV